MPLSDLSSPPLRIELRPSRALRAALVILAALAALALLLSAAPRWALVLVPLLLVIAWPRLPVHGWCAIVLRGDGTAAAIDAEGTEHVIVPALLQRRGWLTLLTLEAGGRRYPQLFTPGTLGADERRRLGLWFDRHAAPILVPKVAAHV